MYSPGTTAKVLDQPLGVGQQVLVHPTPLGNLLVHTGREGVGHHTVSEHTVEPGYSTQERERESTM